MNFPIVKIDRTTAQEWLPTLMNKGIFSNYRQLKTMDSIIEEKKAASGGADLTKEQMREACTQAGEYRTRRFVFHDYGNYAIGFDIKMYYEFLNEAEKYLSDEVDPEKINDALRQIHLYKLGHKIAMIILSEAYRQRRYEELTISKSDIVSYLGYNTEDKQIYQDIDDAMFSLRWLNYIFYQYRTAKKVGKDAMTTGNFIYNLQEDNKSYTVWINKVFLGCIEFVLQDETNKLGEEEKQQVFSRGYYGYDTALLPMTRNYSTPAYLLSHFLVLDSGNAKLNTDAYKIVAYKVSRFIEEAGIKHSRPSKRKNAFIRALQEVTLISRTEPGIEDLHDVKPGDIEDIALRVYIKK